MTLYLEIWCYYGHFLSTIMDPFDPKESTEEYSKLMCLLPVKYGLLKHPLSNSCFGHYGTWPCVPTWPGHKNERLSSTYLDSPGWWCCCFNIESNSNWPRWNCFSSPWHHLALPWIDNRPGPEHRCDIFWPGPYDNPWSAKEFSIPQKRLWYV